MNGAPAVTQRWQALPFDTSRGTTAMLLFILSEAMLFLMLFFSYFYLGRNAPRWPMHPPPEYVLALVMLGVLLLSSGVLHWGTRRARQGHDGTARLAVVATIALAVVFLGLQVAEFREHLRTLQPTADAYASIFYTITSVHAAHLGLGLCMLVYVAVLPAMEDMPTPPHRPLHATALYWHFVDGVWLVIVAVLYLAPHLVR